MAKKVHRLGWIFVRSATLLVEARSVVVDDFAVARCVRYHGGIANLPVVELLLIVETFEKSLVAIPAAVATLAAEARLHALR